MNVEQLKKAISEAFEKAAEEAAKKILEEVPRKKIEEESETWKPGGVIRTSIGDLANESYYEIQEDGTKKTEFIWDEAMEIEKKTNGKWRVPTLFEWDRLLEEFGKEDNRINIEAFIGDLCLTDDGDGYGSYWSSTPYGDIGAYYLNFSGTETILRNSGTRRLGRSVRCVRVEEEK